MWIFFLSLVAMIRRNISEGVYGGGFFNYLVFLGDSLILAFIILIYEKKFNKPWHWIILAASVLCYMILGFRYRILLLIIGVIYHFVITNRLSIKTLIKWAFIGWGISYSINFITLNRTALKTLEFSDVTFESKVQYGLSPYQLVMNQTDNYKTEMMVVKQMKKNNVDYDYGESMFTHIFIRIIPASFFKENKKPEIPQMNTIKNSFNSKEGRYAGAAISNVTEYYLAFGIFGIILFMTVLGFFLGYISKRTNINVPRDRVIIVMIAMVMFQEITRGYLPQNVTLLVFLLITLKLFYKKQYVSNHNQHTNTI
jgi:oligosaccharide repeat unit polymerase